jgi:TorA maturation chaperone TorD
MPIPSNTQSKISDLKSEIQKAAACVFVHQFLSRAFAYPTPEEWACLSNPESRRLFVEAVELARLTDDKALVDAARELALKIAADGYELFYQDYVEAFGHAARGRCPLNEIEYGDLKADPLFQPHRLADLGAFYRAFGLELGEESCERHDHISLEFEFMSVLWAKELYALERDEKGELASICRGARRMFLREHLGRWVPAFARRLSRFFEQGSLHALACFTREWVEAECRHSDVTPGSEDILLRSVDEVSESLCSSCGITSLPPGAGAPEG